MKPIAAITVAASVLIAVGSAAVWVEQPELLGAVTREDGPAEYGTALLYLFSALLFFGAGRVGGLHRLWCWGLALLVFLVAGEEISWGQRIIGVSTPEELATVNVQHELNLHNIDGIHQNVRMLAMLFVLAVCFAMPLGHRFFSPVRATFAKLQLPLFPLWAVPAATLAVAFMVLPRLQGTVVFELDEIGELLLAVAMTGFAAATRVASLLPKPAALRAAPSA